MERVTVNARALHEVLTALVGGSYLIRELQATCEPKELFADNPINILVKEYNSAATRPAEVGGDGVPLVTPMPATGWVIAADNELVSAHLGVAEESDTAEQAALKLCDLINWHVAVATDPAVNGGYVLTKQQSSPASGGQS